MMSQSTVAPRFDKHSLYTTPLPEVNVPQLQMSDREQGRLTSDRAPTRSPSKRTSIATRTDAANRRRSVLRDHKPPQGPRPPEFSSRRMTSTSAFGGDSEIPPFPQPVSDASSSQQPSQNNRFIQQLVRDDNTSKAPLVTNSVSTNADKSSLDEARLDEFPNPAGQRRQSAFNKADTRATLRDHQSHRIPSNADTYNSDTSSEPQARFTSKRSKDLAARAAQHSTESSTGRRISAFPSSASRRQSQLPPSSTSSLPHLSAKQPRKSIGPSYNAFSSQERPVFDPASRALVTETPSSQNDISTGRRISQAPPKSRSSANAGLSNAALSESNSNKGLTLDTSPSQLQNSHAFLDLPPPETLYSINQDNRSPVRAGTHPMPAQAPSLAARRQSSAVLGTLGVRTVSPTDVRRSRRMSISNNRPPPLPARTPTPETATEERQPPTPGFPKSMTPVSPRDTPDIPQRKNSGRSVSSRSSFNSARPTSSSSQRRSSFTNFSARSPTIKSRNLASSHGADGEMVPPVPAIPKAYESPSEVVDKPFFSDLPPSLLGKNAVASDAHHADEQYTTADEGPASAPMNYLSFPKSRRLTLGARPDGGRDISNLTTNKQFGQGPRLPPINLLPLSTPTTNKIASLTQKSQDTEPGTSTPPPAKGPPKTPSTPMTASKAQFPSYDFQHNFDLSLYPNLRSNTSYAAQKSETSTLNESGSDSPAVNTPASPAPPTPRHGPSPFGSFSLPRPQGEMQQLAAKKNRDGTKDATIHGRRSSRSLIRRPSNISKQPKETRETKDNTHAYTDTETSQTGSSLRRKLSIGWRRSSSKASHLTQQHDDDRAIQSTNEMPPPKLPTSSTKQNSSQKLMKSSVSAAASQTDLNANVSQSRPVNSSNVELTRSNHRQSTMKGDSSNHSSKHGSSLFSMQRMLGSRSSSHNMKVQRSTAGLDRDDLAAEEEMRKLGSKKKEFESSARELDDLKKRAAAKERVSPSHATQMAALNIFEKGEIIDYKTEGVFFCGTKDAKKFVGDLAANSSNFGFDDDRGDYNIVTGDHLAYRYEVIDILGKGSFGQVVRCVDHKTGGLVAIKIIRNKKRFHHQALVEVNILQKLREWDPDSTHSMINFTQCFYFRGHLCIATELLGINLYEFIKAHDFVGFSLKLIRRFTKQMLSSLCLLQEHNVIHCDLKPENILLTHPLHSEIKVIDFGSSCFDNERVYTYIQSRFYRSPEVILGMNYGMPIDMWSLGCILAELFTGYPIFPGENEQEQLGCIMEVFGPPEKHLIEKSSRKKVFFDSVGKPRLVVSSKGKRRRPSSKTLTQALKCDDEAFIDFIAKCLRWDPERRMRPDEAMTHDFVTGTKRSTRGRTQTGAAVASPAKRSNTIQTPAKPRNVPEPPATSYKNGVPVSSRTSSISPVKGAGPAARRKSNMYEQQSGSGSRVTSSGTSSGLPRATAGQQRNAPSPKTTSTQRNASNKPDLASAAAAISLAGGTRNRSVANGT